MATWKKVLVEGLDLTGSDVINNQKDLVIGAGLSLDGTAATSAASQNIDNILLGADGDVTIAINIAGQTDLGNGVAGTDLILVADVSDSNNIKKTTVADIIGSVDTGVTSITSGNGLTANSSQAGAVTINLDTSTLSDTTVSATTEFIVSNGDVEGVEAAGDIGLEVFSNVTTAFINLTALSVGTEGTASGDGSIAYNNTTGVFTYTPPDLSGYSTTDTYATSFAYTGGTTAGPTGTLTLSDSNTVDFGAIPSAGASASGVVTTGPQTFAGNKTFSDNVIVGGNLTVQGSVTTIESTTLTVADKNVILADPASAYSTDDIGAGQANVAASLGGITLISHHGTDEDYFAAATWKYTGDLTGWQVRNTADFSGETDVVQEDFPIAIMEFSANSAPGSGDLAAGVGSFRFDTTLENLYIRVA